MDNVSILKVRDKDEDQEALAIVRPINSFIALTLSLEHGGDVQVAFTPAECNALVLRLQQAANRVLTEHPNANDGHWHQEIAEIDLTENLLVGATDR